jgi:hypothetical protein
VDDRCLCAMMRSISCGVRAAANSWAAPAMFVGLTLLNSADGRQTDDRFVKETSCASYVNQEFEKRACGCRGR